MEMNYKKISFLIIIIVAVVLLGGLAVNHFKYNLSSFLTASLIPPPTQIKDQHITAFAVFAGAAISDATPASGSITGDVGLTPTGGTAITGLTCAEMTGVSKIYDNNAGYTGNPAGTACLTTDSALLITAKGELSAAYNDAKGRTGATTVTANATDSFAGIGTGVGGYTLAPGVYKSGSSMGVPVSLTLDGGGNTNAVFIFQTGTTLNTANSSVINLINGTQACNVFWQVGSSAILGTGSDFSGTVMAAVSITDAGGSTVHGRLLADADNTDADSTGAVALSGTHVIVPTCADALANGACGTAAKSYLYTDVAFSGTMCGDGNGVTTPASPAFPAAGNSVTWTCAGIYGGIPSGTCTASAGSVPPATLTLVKTIIGGAQTFADFPLTATGTTTITGVYPASAITNAIVSAGTYALSEKTQSDYTAGVWSCLKNDTPPAVTGASIALASGDSAICTIQNTYSGGGGNSYPKTLVPPLIEVVKVPSPLALPSGPGPVTYTYKLRNIGTVPVNNITMVDDTCGPVIFVSGDMNSDSRLDMNETWTYDCFKTLSATDTNTVVATGWADGVSATDIATATVVVGSPIVPPLIHVTKVPSPLALPAGGGMVTYTKKVTNPGTVALSNIQIADDKCGAVKYVSGDANSDSKLDPAETWTYSCSANLTKTTTNTVTVSGQANGLTARDFAIATVIVATPKLPNTGFAPSVK